jgi:hypothetical protein
MLLQPDNIDGLVGYGYRCDATMITVVRRTRQTGRATCASYRHDVFGLEGADGTEAVVGPQMHTPLVVSRYEERQERVGSHGCRLEARHFRF